LFFPLPYRIILEKQCPSGVCIFAEDVRQHLHRFDFLQKFFSGDGIADGVKV
jgi:hypothetical protein